MAALARGDVWVAADHNLLVVALVLCAIAVMLAAATRPTFRRWLLRLLSDPPTSAVWTLVVVISAFTVLRNTSPPLGEWLASGVSSP